MDPFGLYVLLFFGAQSVGHWEYLWSVLIFQTSGQRDGLSLRLDSV